MGTLVAWVLVRDSFPGKRVVNSLIDLPFALPTIVAGLTLIALYGPDSPVGIHLAYTRGAVIVALLFVTLPFVARSVQPVLIELDREVEEAAASLGASNATTFRRIVLPALRPAIISGAALAFARSVGEFGSLALIAGKVQIASIVIYADIESGSEQAAAALSVVLMVIALLVLFALRRIGAALIVSRRATLSLRAVALLYLALLLLLPLGDRVLAHVRARHRHRLGVHDHAGGDQRVLAVGADRGDRGAAEHDLRRRVRRSSWPGARLRASARAILDALIDLPFVVSPVIVGLALLLVYGQGGWFGSVFLNNGIRIIYAVPGMVIATVFVSLPFVVREVTPVLREVGDEQEQAAATLGASSWQTFWRVTLPTIRWGVAYGVVLTTARALGEIGAVLVVSSNVAGSTLTLPLLALPARRPGRRPGDDQRVRAGDRAGGAVGGRAARDDRVRTQKGEGAMRIEVDSDLQAVRRLHRARRRLARRARGRR